MGWMGNIGTRAESSPWKREAKRPFERLGRHVKMDPRNLRFFWTWYRTFGLHKKQWIDWPAERLLASVEGPFSMELVSFRFLSFCVVSSNDVHCSVSAGSSNSWLVILAIFVRTKIKLDNLKPAIASAWACVRAVLQACISTDHGSTNVAEYCDNSKINPSTLMNLI
jgi:hypothetical protein